MGFELLNKYGINKLQASLQETYLNTSETNTTSEVTNTADEASSENTNAVNNATVEAE